MSFGKRFRILAAALLVAFCGIAVAPVAKAEEDVPDYRLQMSPAKLDLELESGKTKKETFEVQNTGAQPFKFKVSVAPYSVKNEAYESDFIAETQYTEIANWITLSDTKGTLAPGAKKEITATIKVPKDVPGGGQYAVILAQLDDDSESEQSAVKITQQVGIVVYSSVKGDTRNGGKVLENKVSSFLFNPPISATSLIENTGNTHVRAQYILRVYPLFSDEEVYTNEENPETRIILPETRRFNTISWEGAPKLGLFKVKQTVKIYEETSETEKLVFLCPIWFLFIIILLVFCIIFWIVSRVRGRKVAE